MRHESESERRESHNATEQRRRLKINKNIQDLQELIPSSTENSNNKAAVLLAAVEYISHLKDLCTSLVKQNEHLENENYQFEDELAALRGDKDVNGKREVHQHANSAFERPLRTSSGEREYAHMAISLPMPIPSRSNSSSGSTTPSSFSLSMTPSPSTSPTHPDFLKSGSKSNSNSNSTASTPSTSPNQTTTTTITKTSSLMPNTTTTTTTTTTSQNATTTTTTTLTNASGNAYVEAKASFGLGHILNDTSSPNASPPNLSISSSSSSSS
eukprot:TRINITY_DN955_c0_g1_i1.p1 TRINITY_DN955_c0_g1~~TRINITY_DN955_c0_g1_i1.p1  ORF type:complete len:270 (-),score=54.89 TRINITY_DN955_c0_g1_i1:48-857(-)